MPIKPLINKKYKLQRFQDKGGSAYASIPEVVKDKNSPFGWVRVKGFIDDYEFKNYHLMPMGNENLFFPLKAEIRNRIGKKEGDIVNIVLYKDESPLKIPDELLSCLRDEPKAFELFDKPGEGYQKEYIRWMYSAKKEEIRIARIVKTINKVLKGQLLSKKPE